MSSHTSRTFLNSCVKTPIDPCNKCPAPIYNRSKMYLGRLTTPISITTGTKYATSRTSRKSAHFTETETENVAESTMWGTCSGLRSLAKLYDSIPDYCDINHLSEGEFYSTLNTLRTTCNELKTKTPTRVHCESSCSAATTTTTTTTPTPTPTNSTSMQNENKNKTKKKSSKSTVKKKSSKSGGCRKKFPKSIGPDEITLESSWRLRESDTPCDVMGYEKTTLSRTNAMAAPPAKSNYKQECEDEVAAFRRTLKDFEDELRRTSYTSVPVKSKSTTFLCKDKGASNLTKIREDADKANSEIDYAGQRIDESRSKTHAPISMREKLKKSFSFNDLHSIAESDESLKEKMQAKAQSAKRMTKAEMLAFRDRTKLSNYFAAKANERKGDTPNEQDLPRIVVETPNSDSTLSTEISIVGAPKRKSKCKKQQDELKLPFSIFSFNECKKENERVRSVSVSPKHPVARPNLAATLRAEVSKKKLKELQNTCTYHDTTPPVDWEVRKTPAWKSLSLNETHKQILAMRLATRKAEQDLQKREYDLNMELMRQRVKSAPLLLEGMTYWGPNVGKLTHTCQMDGMRHACHSSLRSKPRKKSGGIRRTAGGGGGGGSESGIGCGSRLSNKLQSLRKIYASSAGTCSRQSQRSAASEGVGGGSGKSKRTTRSKTPAPQIPSRAATAATNDSGDELCSIDRAYL